MKNWLKRGLIGIIVGIIITLSSFGLSKIGYKIVGGDMLVPNLFGYISMILLYIFAWPAFLIAALYFSDYQSSILLASLIIIPINLLYFFLMGIIFNWIYKKFKNK